MSNGIVVDANVMNQFTQALINDLNNDVRFLISSIRGTHGFAVDDRGQIEQQWRNTCGHRLFGEWLVQGLKEGVVRMVTARIDEGQRKKLRIDLGFPTGGYEGTYVAVAAAAIPHYIVTDDIDFWEPKYKKADEKKKAETKADRSGGVYKFLTKKIGVEVGTVLQAITDFGYKTV